MSMVSLPQDGHTGLRAVGTTWSPKKNDQELASSESGPHVYIYYTIHLPPILKKHLPVIGQGGVYSCHLVSYLSGAE